MASLFEPLTLRGVTFRNRLFMSPMCQYSARDGVASDWHLAHYGARAAGGAGLVMFEATAVSPEGRISPADLGLWRDDQAEVLGRVVRFVKSQGAAAGVQIAHAGRKASTALPWDGGHSLKDGPEGWTVAAPSAVPFGPGFPVPEALSEEGLRKVVRDFEDAARRADRAGFDVLEIHAAHGYLLHEFLSPLSNRRRDVYGGPFENRVRFPLEVVAAVRRLWPSPKPLFVRLSATDWMEPEGWTSEQAAAFARELKKSGVDLIDVSTGGLVPEAKIPVAPAFQVRFAELVRNEALLPVSAVGLLTEAAQMDALLRMDRADAVCVGRQLLRDPYFALHAAAQLSAEGPWPKQYSRAQGR